MNNKSTQQQHAFNQYFRSDKSQKEIASDVGVSEKTMCAWIRQGGWDKLKRAAMQAPAMIVENLQSQLVEMQNHIMSREPGHRFPSFQEAEIQRKLIVSIEKLKWHQPLAHNMQVMKNYTIYTNQHDRDFTRQAMQYAQDFFTRRSANDYKPYEMEYGVLPSELLHVPDTETTQPQPDDVMSNEMEVSSVRDAEGINNEEVENIVTPAGGLHSMEVNLPLNSSVNSASPIPPPPDWSLPLNKGQLPPGFGHYLYGTDVLLDTNKVIDLRTGRLPRLQIDQALQQMGAKRYIVRPGKPTIITDIGDNRSSAEIMNDLFGNDNNRAAP